MKISQISKKRNCPGCGKPFKKDEPYPDVKNCEVCERYGPPVTEEFCYNIPSKTMWRDLIRDAMKEYKISFDLENDDNVASRDIKINDRKFYCELWKAGGDWQNPICYFRCEIKDGHIEKPYMSQHMHPHFIFIPGKNEGNSHLVKAKRGWSAPDNNGQDNQSEPDEKLCWKSLTKHLSDLC